MTAFRIRGGTSAEAGSWLSPIAPPVRIASCHDRSRDGALVRRCRGARLVGVSTDWVGECKRHQQSGADLGMKSPFALLIDDTGATTRSHRTMRSGRPGPQPQGGALAVPIVTRILPSAMTSSQLYPPCDGPGVGQQIIGDPSSKDRVMQWRQRRSARTRDPLETLPICCAARRVNRREE